MANETPVLTIAVGSPPLQSTRDQLIISSPVEYENKTPFRPTGSETASPHSSRTNSASATLEGGPQALPYAGWLRRVRTLPGEAPIYLKNPFKVKNRVDQGGRKQILGRQIESDKRDSEHETGVLQSLKWASIYPTSLAKFFFFFTDTLPLQIYLHLLLRIPSLYFSRVERFLKDAEVSGQDIELMMVKTSSPGSSRGGSQDWNPAQFPGLKKLKDSWEAFVHSLVKEWKTLNVVSALLLSAILTMLELPVAAADPVTRTTALLSFVCALMSLSYGCVYITRSHAMRSMHNASRWIEEGRRTRMAIFWNVWVFLALPAVWLAWSMLLFVVTFLAYIWRTGTASDETTQGPPKGTSPAVLIPRIIVTCVFGLGVVYFAMIVGMLKWYGWRIDSAAREAERERQRNLEHDRLHGPRAQQITSDPEAGHVSLESWL